MKLKCRILEKLHSVSNSEMGPAGMGSAAF